MVKKLILPLCFMCFGMILLPAGFIQNPYFISDPTVSPDGETIVFVYENDLWRVSALGGTAFRLTSLEGQVSVPRFFPNGQWLAFTSTRDNNATFMYCRPGGVK